jgi:hypothetical protein
MTAWIDRTSGEHDELSLKLVELLASIYRRREDVDEALEDISEIDLLDVPWPDTFRARRFWTAYVIDLRRTNKLRTLLVGLAPRLPAGTFDPYLQRYNARPSGGWYRPATALQAKFVGPGASHPIINRERLRDQLRLLHSEGYRTLSITGLPGKTFSLELLQLYAESEGFDLLHVDVADWGTEPFTAIELVKALATQLTIRIDTSAVDDVPDPHTRARLLLLQIRGAFPTRESVVWIVVDGIDRANVDPDARALVERLFKSIDVDNKPARTRLVVTGFNGLLPRDTCQEAIGRIGREELRHLLDACNVELGLGATSRQLSLWTRQLWSAYDPTRQDLRDVGQAVYGFIRARIDGSVGGRTG